MNIIKLHADVHRNVFLLSTKLMTLMLVVLESFPKGNFNTRKFNRNSYIQKFWPIFVDIKILEKYLLEWYIFYLLL